MSHYWRLDAIIKTLNPKAGIKRGGKKKYRTDTMKRKHIGSCWFNVSHTNKRK